MLLAGCTTVMPTNDARKEFSFPFVHDYSVVNHVAFDWRDGRYHTRLLSREEYLGWADVMETRGCRDLSLYNLFGQPRSSPENVLTLTCGLVGSAVAKEPRRYPLSHRDRCFSGPRDPAYPPRLSTLKP